MGQAGQFRLDRSGQVILCQVRCDHVDQVRSGQVWSGSVWSGQVRTARLGQVIQVSSGQFSSGKASWSAQVSGQIRSIRSGQAGRSGQVRSVRSGHVG